MKKFLNVIAFAILAVGLAIGGIMCLVNFDSATDLAKLHNTSAVKIAGGTLGVGIAMLIGAAASAIGAIASFFTTKTKQ